MPSPAAARRTALHDAFTVTAAGGAGRTADAVRSPRLVAPSRGVRYPADTPDPVVARAAAALISTRPPGVLCDVTAALRWSLPLPPWLGMQPDEVPVGVAVPAGGHRPQRTGVKGRRLRLPAGHLTVVDGFDVTTPARTWVDCAEFLPLEHLVAMGDVVLRRSLADRDELARMVTWARGRRGVVRARLALPILDPGSESPGESITRATLVQRGVPRPVCNMDIVINGEWLARVDLAWPGRRVIVEYDGIGHLPEAQRRKDAIRRNLLQDAGWFVIVFTAGDLRYPDRMAWLVRSALARTR